jgi:hypothetical protein
MRPRFTVRWLLVFIAASATLCYVLFVRPTVVAYRFVTAIERRDYAAANGLLLHNWRYGITPPLRNTESITFAYAEVLPREWSDIWALRRRLILRIRRKDNSDGRHIEWTRDWDVVAHVRGLEIVVMQADSVRFTPKGDGLIINAPPRRRDATAKDFY